MKEKHEWKDGYSQENGNYVCGGVLMENVELKNIESEMKNLLGGSNSRLNYRRNNLWTWRWAHKNQSKFKAQREKEAF